MMVAIVGLSSCSPKEPAQRRVDTTLPEAQSVAAETTPNQPTADTMAPEAPAAPDEPVIANDPTDAANLPDDDSPEALPHLITAPSWVRRPSGEDMARYYPDRAQRAGSEGQVILSCTVSGSGALEDCGVEQEIPEDMGFGEAALRISRFFRMQPRAQDGAATAGGTVRIPLSFRLPQS